MRPRALALKTALPLVRALPAQRRGLELLKRILASPKCPPFSKWETDGDGAPTSRIICPPPTGASVRCRNATVTRDVPGAGFISPEELRSMFAKVPSSPCPPPFLPRAAMSDSTRERARLLRGVPAACDAGPQDHAHPIHAGGHRGRGGPRQ